MYTLRLINFPLNKELKEIYLFLTIKSLALSMFGIFIPLYLLIDLGFPLKSVLLFFIIAEVVWILSSFFSGKVLARIGAKHTILLGVFLTIVYLMFLVTMKQGILPYFYLAAFFDGISASLYWMGFHANFVRSSHRKYRGQEASIWMVIPKGINLFGPILGGLILTFFSFESLFILVSILMIFSTIPLFLSRDVFKRYHYDYKKIFGRIKLKESLGLFGMGIRARSFTLLWPIFVFFILGTYLSLGSLFSFATLLGVVFFIIVGRWSDKVDKRTLISAGSIMHSFTWFVRTPIQTALQVFSIASLDMITSAVILVPFDALSYDRAAEGNPIEYIAFREIILHMGALFLLVFMLFIQSFSAAFILTGLSSLLLIFF
ncbi:MFS transporter [Candidatus Woesearchaeota archaeon]|nr:MFS transporter [Candidatus Woesearchaeota archaeon]